MSAQTYKVQLPVLIVAIAGGVILAEYFFTPTLLSTLGSELKKMGILVFSMSMVVGLVGVTINGVKKISSRAPGEWYLHVWLLCLLYFWVIVGLIYTPTHDFYQWLFANFITALYQSMLALPSISLFVAIYRAYKVRFELNSVLLTVSFFLVLVAGAPLGEAIWGGFSPIRKWVIEIPTASAERGLIITMALGVIGLSLRTIFGIERTWLGLLRMPAVERREGEENE